jgi:hypothetical protein
VDHRLRGPIDQDGQGRKEVKKEKFVLARSQPASLSLSLSLSLFLLFLVQTAFHGSSGVGIDRSRLVRPFIGNECILLFTLVWLAAASWLGCKARRPMVGWSDG